jgi:hypothetical protein
MIGSNMSLSPSGSTPSPFPVQKSQPSPFGQAGYTGQSTIKKPNYLSMDTTEDAVNNVMAKGYQQGDGRFQMKQLDRAGISRGRGQQFVAGQEGAQAVGEAANKSAEMRVQDMAANSKMRSDYEKAREQEAQQMAMIQHARSQTDWTRQFAEQSAAAQIKMAQQQAKLQLMMALMKKD